MFLWCSLCDFFHMSYTWSLSNCFNTCVYCFHQIWKALLIQRLLLSLILLFPHMRTSVTQTLCHLQNLSHSTLMSFILKSLFHIWKVYLAMSSDTKELWEMVLLFFTKMMKIKNLVFWVPNCLNLFKSEWLYIYFC